MANYFVSEARGLDTNAGTAVSPWKTIGHAIGPSPAITLSGTGDTVYIEPGIYRETVQLSLSPTGAGPLSIIGDCDGAGFLAGGYTTPATGTVDWRAWTDDSTPSANILLNATGPSYVSISHLKCTPGTNYAIGIASGSTNWTIIDCIFVGGNGFTRGIHYDGSSAGAVAANLTVDRCDFWFCFFCVWLNLAKSTAEYNAGVLLQNCRFSTTNIGVDVLAAGTGTALATGVSILGCSFLGGPTGVAIYSGVTTAMATPLAVKGCGFVRCNNNGIAAGATSQVADDYNRYSHTSVTNVTLGANSNPSCCPALDFGDGRLRGLPHRPFGEPLAVSPYGGVGAYPGAPAVDILNRSRPEGCGSIIPACGALERHDTGAKNTTYADTGSPACLALVGPSSEDHPLLVEAAATTISVKVRWDGNHGDTTKPQAILLANPEIGVAGQTVTASSAGGTGSTPNAYETLTFASITPTAAGVVMLRMVSRAAAGNGFAYFDTIAFA